MSVSPIYIPSFDVNDFVPQDILRKWMKNKQLLPLSKSSAPPPVSPDDLRSFRIDGNPAPDLSAPKMDWNSDLTSDWNTAMIIVLTHGFIRAFETGEISRDYYARSCMSYKEVEQRIRKILWSTKHVYSISRTSMDIEQHLAQKGARSRIKARRNGVCDAN